MAGISSASLSFGYINSWFSYRLHACVLLTILLLQSSREIVGPLVGGALTEAFSFQTSAVVSYIGYIYNNERSLIIVKFIFLGFWRIFTG